ncbi:Reverse transcriptase (RNA-dependent DNA polymerase) [Fragilaria crotonensis]|nr:Reverse transcriptase (RNA-dependent DNA polymerase) [Fragilaria crotonensis]
MSAIPVDDRGKQGNPRESKERNISGVKSGAKDQLKDWGDKKGKRSVAALKKQIKEELKNEMKKLARNDNDGDDDHESSADEAAGRNSVAALTRRSRSWIRPDNAEPLRWFRGRYTQWITMQYTESVIVRVGARWTLTPTHAWQEIPIATVATAYDCPTSGATYVIIINEALYFGDSLPFSLLSPNQLRDNDVHVDERHRQHAPDSIFGILVPSEPLRIPFTLEGVVAGFDSRPPTQDELDNTALHVELTSDVEWIPHTFALSLVEEDVLDSEDEEEITNLRAR